MSNTRPAESNSFLMAQPLFGAAHVVTATTWDKVAGPAALTSQRDNNTLAYEQTVKGDAEFRRRNYRAAMAHFSNAIRLSPNDATHHMNLAVATWQAGDLDLVDRHFYAALALEKNSPLLHETMAWWFAQQGRIDSALHHSREALRLVPDGISPKATLAETLCADGQFRAAWEVIEPSISVGAGGQWLARVFAKIAPHVGREAQAVETIERELRDPNLPIRDRTRLHYAIIALLDALGRFDSAFAHAKLANAGEPAPWEPVASSKYFSDRIAYYTRARLKALPRPTRRSQRPVLIVGMPRSGTSLVEQILSSHPEVFGAGELPLLSQMAMQAGGAGWANGEPFPRHWDHLSIARANKLAAHYLDRIDALNSTTKFVTDKMPQNFLFLGTAELLLPDCRVIHCIRDKRDTCLSCYFTDFAIGSEFSFNLWHLSAYYQDYIRLMEHWKKVLTIPILDVHYEDLISDPAAQSRRLIDFLDLPWDEKCLSPQKNKRHVATASRDQVRKPIYSSSVGRWKQYERHIPELL